MRSGSCPRQQMPQPERPRPMWRAIYTPLPIVLALTLLPAIAFASPPDPSWIAGIYDGADGDDIVSLVYDTSVATAVELPHTAPLPCLQAMTLDGIASIIPGSRFTGGPRSPPVLCSPEFAYVFDSLPPPASGAEAPVTLPSITTVWPCPSAVSWRAASRNSRPRKWSIAENPAFPCEAVPEVPRRSFH